MAAKESIVMVRLIDPTSGADHGAVSGAPLTHQAGADANHASFTITSDHVVKLAKRCRGGLVLEIADKSRVKWRCPSPTVEGSITTAQCTRVEVEE